MTSIRKVITVELWRQELNSILQEQRTAEIELIGNSVSYLRDKVYSSGLPFQNLESLEEAIKQSSNRLFSCRGNNELLSEALSKTAAYEYHINWVEAFLMHDNIQWYRIFGLFIALVEAKPNNLILSKEAFDNYFFIATKVSTVLLGHFLQSDAEKRLQKRFKESADELFEQKQEFIHHLESLPLDDIPERFALIKIRSLIHLQAWSKVNEDRRKEIIVWLNFKKWVRSQLLSEIINTHTDTHAEFSVFIDDCKRFYNQFYEIIFKHSPQWEVKQHEPPSVSDTERLINFEPISITTFTQTYYEKNIKTNETNILLEEYLNYN